MAAKLVFKPELKSMSTSYREKKSATTKLMTSWYLWLYCPQKPYVKGYEDFYFCAIYKHLYILANNNKLA